MGLLDTLAARLTRRGLNLIGTARVAAYDRRVSVHQRLAPLAPEGRTAIVIGNGGGAFWDAFRAATAGDPDDAITDPLDRFTRAVVTDATADVPAGRLVFPFDFPDVAVSFQDLALEAGLGQRSLVGVLVHPEYGPWIALRAALVVPEDLHAPRPADGFDPCPTCTLRPCIAACPAGAVGPGGWNVPACTGHRLAADEHCASGCASRVACVYGGAHRYPDEALRHHQAHARRVMAVYASAATKP